MTVADYQAQIGDSGIVLGAAAGYRIESIEGLGRDSRAIDADRENADGTVPGPEFSPGRLVTITMTITGSTVEETIERVDALAADWNSIRRSEGVLGTAALHFKLPGRVAQQIPYGRPRRFAPIYRNLALKYVPVLATYYAADPRIYSEVEHVVDLNYGASNVTVPNAGNHPAPVQWDVYGAVTDPGLIRSEAARFDIAGTIGSGTYFRVRSDPKTVVRSSDAANRYQDLTGTFLEIPAAGALFRAVGSTTTQKIRATYRDTWMSA